MHCKYGLRKWLLSAAFAGSALLLCAQQAGDTVTAPKNQLSIDLQFLGRGESRYGGLLYDNTGIDKEEEEENVKTAKSSFVMGRTRLPINFKRDWLGGKRRFQPLRDLGKDDYPFRLVRSSRQGGARL